MIIVLPSTILDDPVSNRKAGEVVTFTSAYKTYSAIIKVQNEVGTDKCDPSIQGAETFAIYWSQEKVTPLRKACCCPSLIIAIAGPWM
ncbi:hypothetical protein FRC08_005656, partial [Ceratobasidium sp. 394]